MNVVRAGPYFFNLLFMLVSKIHVYVIMSIISLDLLKPTCLEQGLLELFSIFFHCLSLSNEDTEFSESSRYQSSDPSFDTLSHISFYYVK